MPVLSPARSVRKTQPGRNDPPAVPRGVPGGVRAVSPLARGALRPGAGDDRLAAVGLVVASPPARAGHRQRSCGKGNDGEMPAVTWKGPEHGRAEAGLGSGQTPRASGPSSPGARAPRAGILTWGFSGHVESLQAENSEGELSLTRFSPVADAICQFQK